MIKILINVWFPVEKGEEVYKKYLEIERVFPMDPSKIKPVIPTPHRGILMQFQPTFLDLSLKI